MGQFGQIASGAGTGFWAVAGWRKALLASVAIVLAASLVERADAAPLTPWGYGAPPVSRAYGAPPARKAKASPRSNATNSQSKRDVPIRHPFGENMPKGPLQLVVSIADQHITLYSNGMRVAQAKVSTGTPSHPTPTGIFSVIQKNRWHRSNLYGSAPMWYMHRLTWSGIALHEGVLPGRPASHGCIRLPQDFVSRLWNVSKLGVRVVVSRIDVAPRDIAHAKLFNPKPKPVDGSTVSEIIDGTRSTSEKERTEERRSASALIQVAEAPIAPENAPTITDAPSAARSAIAAGRAPILRKSIGVEVPAASVQSVAADTPSQRTAAPATDEATSQRTATSSPAMSPTVAIDSTSAAAMTTATVPAQTIVTDPAPAIVAAPAIADPPPAFSQPVELQPSASEPARAPTLSAMPTDPMKPVVDPNELQLPRPAPLRTRSAEPAKLNGQVAVLVSRKEKRIFVRHAFVPLFDMPVEIDNADYPIGHHVYTALEVRDDGARMRWNVITMPPQLPPANASAANAKNSTAQQKYTKRQKRVAPYDPRPASNAVQALERISIPQEAIDRISELLVPGSSLIISDEGLGRETGRYTEFIVETR